MCNMVSVAFKALRKDCCVDHRILNGLVVEQLRGIDRLVLFLVTVYLTSKHTGFLIPTDT